MSGYYTHRYINIQRLCILSIQSIMCFIWYSEQTRDYCLIQLQQQLVFLMEALTTYFAVWPEFMCIIYMKSESCRTKYLASLHKGQCSFYCFKIVIIWKDRNYYMHPLFLITENPHFPHIIYLFHKILRINAE